MSDTHLPAKEYLEVQLQQIRMGQEKGLDTQIYDNPEYDWFQMEQIRRGLESGIDVSLYAHPEIPYIKMREIRRYLEEGLDLSSYNNYSAGTIRQIRKAVIDGVELRPFIDKYDAEQLEQIRMALVDRIDLTPFLDPIFGGVSIREMRLGLEKGLDIGVYANLNYDWRQMREIRLGMEERLEYSAYAKPDFDWRQMRQIRLGMETELPVALYCDLMYPWQEMKKKRLWLLEQRDPSATAVNEIIRQSSVSENMLVSVKDNEMTAYLTVYSGDVVVSVEDIYGVLNQNGVKSGILEDVVKAVADGRYEKESVLIAKGVLPHMGKEGWYEYFFRTNPDKRPRLLENGDADYGTAEWFETVKEGQKLAVYHPAEPGVPGYTVTGKEMTGKKGQELPMLIGSGFILAPDQKTYYATASGNITLEDGRLTVSKNLDLDEVTQATGNISFHGSLHIFGNVGDGVTINAGDDIIVDGSVGAASITCGGKLVVRNGINAQGKASINAKKGVASRFFESADVTSEGNIEANDCLNSSLYTRGKISLVKTVAGGKLYSEMGIQVKNAGNRAGIKTKLILNGKRRIWNEIVTLETKLANIQFQQESLNHAYSEYIDKYPPEERNADPLFLKIEKSIYALNENKEKLQKEKHDKEQEYMKAQNTKIEISGTAFEGLEVEIEGNYWRATGEKHITLKTGTSRELEVVE